MKSSKRDDGSKLVEEFKKVVECELIIQEKSVIDLLNYLNVNEKELSLIMKDPSLKDIARIGLFLERKITITSNYIMVTSVMES